MKVLTLCYWKGHSYDKERYKIDCEKHWNSSKYENPMSQFKNIEEYKIRLASTPMPFCLRCKKEIRTLL